MIKVNLTVIPKGVCDYCGAETNLLRVAENIVVRYICKFCLCDYLSKLTGVEIYDLIEGYLYD